MRRYPYRGYWPDSSRIAVSKSTADTKLGAGLLYDALLKPTRIYVKSLLTLFKAVPVHGLAHITGGGITGNLPRVIPDGLEAVINAKAWERGPVFDWLQRTGNIAADEMYRTFNCGLGMTLCVAASDADRAMEILRASGEQPMLVGEVRRGGRGVVIER